MASGDSLIDFEAAAGRPPSTGGATPDQRGAAGHEHDGIAFDAAADENWDFEGVLPSQYAGGGCTVDLGWSSPTDAVANEARWRVSWENHDSTQDLDASGLGTATVLDATISGTAGVMTRSTLNISHANMDSPSAGDHFRLRVQREGSHANDDLVGDAMLHMVYITEQ